MSRPSARPDPLLDFAETPTLVKFVPSTMSMLHIRSTTRVRVVNMIVECGSGTMYLAGVNITKS